MSVGAHEVVFLVLLTLFVVAVLAVTKGQSTWLIGIPICVGIAVLVTPPDAGSTFVVAAPYTIGYTFLALRRDRRRRPKHPSQLTS